MKSVTLCVRPHDSDEEFDIKVCVYKNPQGLQKAARRWDQQGESWTGTVGVCHCFETYDYDGGEETRNPLVAIIRLQEENMGVGVVSHEAAHAAVWINDLRGYNGPTNGTDEEFAWVLGEITRQICVFLNEEYPA